MKAEDAKPFTAERTDGVGGGWEYDVVEWEEYVKLQARVRELEGINARTREYLTEIRNWADEYGGATARGYAFNKAVAALALNPAAKEG